MGEYSRMEVENLLAPETRIVDELSQGGNWKHTCTRSKGSVSLPSPSNRNPLQEASLMMAQCLCVSPKRIEVENQDTSVTEK